MSSGECQREGWGHLACAAGIISHRTGQLVYERRRPFGLEQSTQGTTGHASWEGNQKLGKRRGKRVWKNKGCGCSSRATR